MRKELAAGLTAITLGIAAVGGFTVVSAQQPEPTPTPSAQPTASPSTEPTTPPSTDKGGESPSEKNCDERDAAKGAGSGERSSRAM